MKFSLVADHYQHLAIIGVVALMAALQRLGRSRQEMRRAFYLDRAAAVAVALLLGWLTFQQSDSIAMPIRFTNLLSAYSWMAQSSLGSIYLNRGQVDRAADALSGGSTTK